MKKNTWSNWFLLWLADGIIGKACGAGRNDL